MIKEKFKNSKLKLKLNLIIELKIDPWTVHGYHNLFAKLWSAMFEAGPCQMVHGILRRSDASTLCPRRHEWQHHCSNDSQCIECAVDFVDLADLHEMYLAGCLGRHLAAKSPFKSGRRRIVMVQRYGNVEFDDIDVVKMSEHRFGKLTYY